MRNKKYDIPILAIVIVLMFTWAYGANYIIHDFTTGVMHEAKDVYRTNTRSVEDDMDSIEAKIPAGGSADATILAAHMADETTAHGETSENVASRIVTRDASGNFKAGTITGTLSGNASTATQLATPRTIAGTSFDGTANISISHTGLTDKGTLTHAQVENELTRLEIDKADTSAVALKANTADVYNTAAINLLFADKADTGSVTIVSGALASHTGEVSGAHQGSAIAVDSSGFTGNLSLADNTAQKAFAKLDALSGLPATNAITKIYGDSDVDGCETGAVWLVGTNGVQIYRSGNTFEANIDSATKFGGYYTKAETNATIEAAIAVIPAPSVNQTVTVTAGEALTAGQVVSLINESGTVRAYNNPLTVSTSPNGAESVFNAAATTYCSAVALDSTRFLVAYVDSDTYVKAIVGTVTGSTIAWGSESTAFENVAATYVSACKIATDKVLITYRDGTNFGYIRAIVLSVSTNVISNGTPVDVTNENSYPQSSDTTKTIDTDKAIICYQAGSKGKTKIITVSGTTPTPYPAAGDTGTEFNAAATAYISVSALSSTSAIVAFSDGGDSNKGHAQVLSISGTTITPGTEYKFKDATTTYTSVAALSATAAVITYEAGGGETLVATNDSGALSYGTPATFTDGQYNSTAKIDSTHVIIASQVAATNTGQSIIGTISGTGITLGTAYTYNAAESTYNSVCYLGAQKSAICYSDAGNSSYGTSVINTWANPTYASVSGISSGAYSSGSDAVVLISGSYDGLSSLIPGSPYFVNASFELQTTPVSLTSTIYSGAATTREIHFGTAKSSTEIVLNIDYR